MPGLRNPPFIFQQISEQYADVDAMVAARDGVSPSVDGELSCRMA